MVGTILGPDGRPAVLPSSGRNIAAMGAFDGYLANSIRLAPYNPDALVGAMGYRVLEEQLKMAAILAPLNIVRDATLYKGVSVAPFLAPGEDTASPQAQELAVALEFCLNEIEDDSGNAQDPAEIVLELLLGIHMGFRVSEMIWKYFEDGPLKGKLGWSKIAAKPNKQIGFEVDEQTLSVRNITSYTPLTGYQFDVPVEKCLRFTFRSKDGLPYGSATGIATYKHWWTIDLLMKLRNLALELFGSPFLKAHGPEQQLDLIRKALTQIRAGAPAAFTTETTVDLLQVASGGLAAYDSAIETERQQCALAYLGNTLTTDVGSNGGNRALGQVHQGTQQYGLAAVRRAIETVLNRQMVRRWVIYNYGREALAFAPRITLGSWDDDDMTKFVSAVHTLLGDGVMYRKDPQILKRLKLEPLSPELQAEMETERQQAAQQKTQPQSQPPPAKDGGAGETDAS